MDNEYDDIFDEAEKLSDAELGNLGGPNWDKQALLDLKLEGPDKDAVHELIAEVDAAADARAIRKAWGNFGKAASVMALKAAREAVLG